MGDEPQTESQGGDLDNTEQSMDAEQAESAVENGEQPLPDDDSEINNTEEENKQNGDDEEQREDTEVNPSAVVADFEPSEDEDENADDTVNVIIKPTSKGGIYKTGTTYQARSASHAPQLVKASRQGIELDDPGNINGVPTMEFNLSTLGEEDKPWKRPGADITDYFNYGFTEETWIQYCEKQRILRQEYANATLKPVLATGGTGLLQRLRNSSLMSSALKHQMHSAVGSINVVNSAGLLGDRAVNNLLLSGVDVTERLLNSGASGAAATAGGVHFSQPPPGYLSGTGTQLQQTGTFTLPPPSAQLLAGAAVAAAGAGGLFPLPPPVLGGIAQQSGWPGVLGTADSHATMIDPMTGQLMTASGMLDHVNRSPESVYSNENRHISRRSRRHHSPDDGPYFDRSTYRSRRRSRSSSREYHHSRHRRHHESGRSDRESENRRSGGGGGSRHGGHRSREDRREDIGHRYSGPPQPEDQEPGGGGGGDAPDLEDSSCQSRRGGGDRFPRSDSRRVRRRSRSRSGSRRRGDRDRSYRVNPPPALPGRSSRKPDPVAAGSTSQSDPLSIAAAAAANISAAVLGTADASQSLKGS